MASHSSTLAWKIPWTKEPGRLQSMGSLKTGLSDFTFPFHFHALEKEMATNSSVLGLENLRDGEAWWAAVYGVTQSQTRLKRLSSSSSSNRLCCIEMFLYYRQNNVKMGHLINLWTSIEWGTTLTLHKIQKQNLSNLFENIYACIKQDMSLFLHYVAANFFFIFCI